MRRLVFLRNSLISLAPVLPWLEGLVTLVWISGTVHSQWIKVRHLVPSLSCRSNWAQNRIRCFTNCTHLWNLFWCFMSIKNYYPGDSIRSSFDMVGKNRRSLTFPTLLMLYIAFTVRCWVSHCFSEVVLNFTFFFFFFKIYLILASLGLRCCAWAFCCCGMQFSHCCGFSCCWARVLEHRHSSCGHWLCCSEGMCELSRSGIVPVSPALAGGLLATRPTKIPHRWGLQHMHYRWWHQAVWG